MSSLATYLHIAKICYFSVLGFRICSIRTCGRVCDTDSTGNATPPKSHKSRNFNFSTQIQMKPKSQFGFVPRDTKESDLVDFRG